MALLKRINLEMPWHPFDQHKEFNRHGDKYKFRKKIIVEIDLILKPERKDRSIGRAN